MNPEGRDGVKSDLVGGWNEEAPGGPARVFSNEPEVPFTMPGFCKQTKTSLVQWTEQLKCCNKTQGFFVYVCGFLSLDIVWKQKMRLE